MDELIRLVNITLMAFPDFQLHIVDTFCDGNDIDGYKTTMPLFTLQPTSATIQFLDHLQHGMVCQISLSKTFMDSGICNDKC